MSGDGKQRGVPKRLIAPRKKTAQRGRDTTPDAAFDVWLDRGLNSMFGTLAAKPISDELLALIEQCRKGS